MYKNTFVVYKDKKGEWRWRLKSANGKVVADSGEGYKTRIGCRNAAERLHHTSFYSTVKFI